MAARGYVTIAGVDCSYADDGSGTSQFAFNTNQENSRIDATYKMAWVDRDTVFNALRGDVVYFNVTATQGYLRRTIPHQNPEKAWLYCTAADMKGFVAREGQIGHLAHEEARISAHYEGLPYNVVADSDPSVTRNELGINWPVDESIWVGGSFVRYVSHSPPKDKFRVWHARGGTWIFFDTAVPIADGSYFTVHETEHTFVWHQVPYANIPWTAIFNLQGKCNQTQWGPFPGETLVFDGFSISKPAYPLPQATRLVDISYTFTFKPYGANKLPDPDRGWNFFSVIARVGVGLPYPRSGVKNFNDLFRPQTAI